MRIDRLELKNFRCFEDKEFNFSSRFTLLIGENGSGKTTVLDALAAGMGSLLGGFDGMNIRPIKEYEIRHVKRRMGQSTTFEPQPSVYVRCTGEVADSGRISWELSGRQDGAVTYSTINSIIKQAKRMQTRVRAFDESMILPVLGYYGAGRLWRQKSGSLEVLTPASRIKGYVDCLNPSSDEKTLMRWVKTMQIAEIQHNTKIPVLQTVLAAVENCLEDCEAAYYDIELDEFIITLKDKNSLPVYMLSDGQRAILIMAADIAYRAAFLNPQLEMNAPRETPGIVLIDEIDLHLHPAWQRNIVTSLKETFPKIQFIATTHSPFIIQSLRAGELIDLDGHWAEYADKSIEDIAEVQMGVEVPQRSVRYLLMQAAAEEYYRVLEGAKNAPPEKLAPLERKLDELAAPFSDDVAYHSFLKMERLAARLGEDTK